jgi:flagellar basal-body rod modification protein FlgD
MATTVINPTQSFATPPSSDATSAKASNDLTSESAFLKLLVSQIQHQDPLNPSDGVQFLTQLTSFSQLEQLIQINQKLALQPAGSNASDTSDSSTTNPAGS